MRHSEWVDTLTAGATSRAIGEKLRIAHTTIARQVKAEKLTPEMVIDLCRAYGRLPVDGLLETGYLGEGDIDGAGVPQALRWATNRELLAEINRRSEPEAVRLFGKSPEIINPLAPVHDGDAEVINLPYVADSSPDEPEMGDDDYHDGP